MKDIEINSDKYTVLGVCFGLTLVLMSFLGDLYALLKHNPAAHSNLEIGSYLAAIFSTYLAVLVCHDGRLRKLYPYGVLGAGGMASASLIEIAMHWTSASSETQNFAGTVLLVLNIVAAGLVLVEGIRWFKEKVRLSTDV
ncbi:MAG: hypothetical protein WA738_12605 [Candidatus Angelobacter sp.]